LFNKDKNQQKREDTACPTLNAVGWSDGGWGQADARNATCLNASKKSPEHVGAIVEASGAVSEMLQVLKP